MNRMRSVATALGLWLCLCTVSIAEQTKKKTSNVAARPKIGLALAGGGALGFAHVGVLKVLEEERIPVDVVTGTSMGAIVGASYASGRSIAELEEFLKNTDWDQLFDESSARRSVPYRFKAGREREIYGDVKFGFNDDGLVIPAGVVQGQFVVPVLQRLYETVPSPVKFDDLPLPFRAVAADIETGQPVIPTEGDLATVVRASMSVPAFFAPVQFQGHLLVDGGIANNLPIDEAFKLGADRIIAVELYADLKKRKDLEASPLAVTGQMISLLLAQNSALQRKLLRPQDVLIEPDIKGYTSTDFNKANELMAKGEEAARKLVPSLRKFALSQSEYAKYTARRYRKAKVGQSIDFIEVDTNTGISSERLTADFGIKAGDPLDRDAIEEAMRGLYHSGQYREVRYDIVEKNGKTGINLKVSRKEWFDRFVRVGVAVEDDFDGNSDYRLAASYRMTCLNDSGAYAEFNGEIGESPEFKTEYYQPFSKESSYFIAPAAEIGRNQIEVRDGSNSIAEYTRARGIAGLRAGRQLGRSGEFSLGLQRGFGDLERDIGDPALPEFGYDIGDALAKFIIDDLDKPDFPTEGSVVALTARSSIEDLGATDEFNDLTGNVGLPLTSGRNTLILRSQFGTTFEDRPVERSYALGGFFNISGYEQRSLLASDFVVGQALFFHRFSELKLPLFGFDFFAGSSLELAHLQSDVQAIEDNSLITAGSVFIGADTPVLPAYLGFGVNDEDEFSIYFALGRLSAVSQ